MWRSFAFLLLGLLIAASLFWMFATGPSTPDVVVAAPQPDPQPDTKTEPKPEPEPELEPETFTVQLATSPAGATVTQDDRTVCVTPCNIQLVDESALPTTYRVSLSGHRTESYTVTETGHHNVRLIPNAARPSRPGPRPQRPRPDPVPDPEPVAPDPVPENPATEPKPDPKPDIEVLEEVRDPFK